jgi:hypothetical protein
MASTFDLRPTDPLTGLHLVGTVARRFLISYAVPPEALAPYLPPGAVLSTWAGRGWVSACFVTVSDLRPAMVPRMAGLRFNYLVQRTRAVVPFPDGVEREAVLMLEPSINRRLLAVAAAMTTGVRFLRREIALDETPDLWRVTMRDRRRVLLDVEIPKGSLGVSLPAGSLFASPREADRFLLGVSHGAQWQPDRRRLRVLAETHQPWEALVASCRTRTNVLVESLCGGAVEADHAITMTQVPHCFALSGTDVDLRLASCLLPERAG